MHQPQHLFCNLKIHLHPSHLSFSIVLVLLCRIKRIMSEKQAKKLFFPIDLLYTQNYTTVYTVNKGRVLF